VSVRRNREWLAGAACALVFATRPESATSIALLGLYAAMAVRRSHGGRAVPGTLVRIGFPAAVIFAAQAASNAAFTGEWSANGAITKLTFNNPYMTSSEKWQDYLSLFKYVIYRNTEHHLAEGFPWGWLVPVVAAVPLLSVRTRPLALLLWGSLLSWLAVVALNGQVRWQNERYTMAAVAWLLVLFAMGLGLLLRPACSQLFAETHVRDRCLALGRGAAAVTVAAVYWAHQTPQMNDQIWFFGRASRNIREQHFTAGRLLHQLGARRVLVGDAGALMYISDCHGLDLIGLGGFHDLPFARAGLHGLGASLELIERIPPADRPDVLAIYPSWWGDLPTLFGHLLAEAPVHGNVICGGAAKVIYAADWSALDRGGKPRVLRSGEQILDELDVADLVSEKAHAYKFPQPAMGFVEFRVLGDVIDRRRDLFDAGRLIPPGRSERAHVRLPERGGRLVVRTAVSRKSSVRVSINGTPIGMLELEPSTGWIEPSMTLPAGLGHEGELSIIPVDQEWLDCHVWILATGAGLQAESP
jgi:hypothetical protein